MSRSCESIGVIENVNATNTVAIVEDDDSVRRSLGGILQSFDDVKCVGKYGTAEKALEEIPRLAPKVVLMDISLPGMDGVECVRQLANLAPRTQIVMLTVHEDTNAIFNSLAAGASGYLLKPVRAKELIAAVRDVFTGGAPMTSNIARRVVQSFKQSSVQSRGAEELSPREVEVLQCLARGFLYKEIADSLGISYSTVRTHVERIYQKLHVHSRAQAFAKFH